MFPGHLPHTPRVVGDPAQEKLWAISAGARGVGLDTDLRLNSARSASVGLALGRAIEVPGPV